MIAALLIYCYIFMSQTSKGDDREVYFVAFPPKPRGKVPIDICIHILETDDTFSHRTGLFLQSSVSSTFQVKLRLECKDYSVLHYLKKTIRFETKKHTQHVRISFTEQIGSSRKAFDAFSPFPTHCFGKLYILASFSWKGNPFFVLINPNNVDLNIEGSNRYLHRRPGDVYRRQVFVVGAKLRLSVKFDRKTIDRYQLKSSFLAFGVISGTLNATKDNNDFMNNLVEMFPPVTFFAKEYVVIAPKYTKPSTLKIISVYELDSVRLTYTFVTSNRAPMAQTTALPPHGAAYTFEFTDSIHLRATAAILVVQYFRVGRGLATISVMDVIVPPVDRWLWRTFLYPLPLADASNYVTYGSAYVVIKTLDLDGLQIFQTKDGRRFSYNSNIKSLFKPLGTSGYSFFNDFEVSHTSMFYIQHMRFRRFLAIQYGGPRYVYNHAISPDINRCNMYTAPNISVKPQYGYTTPRVNRYRTKSKPKTKSRPTDIPGHLVSTIRNKKLTTSNHQTNVKPKPEDTGGIGAGAVIFSIFLALAVLALLVFLVFRMRRKKREMSQQLDVDGARRQEIATLAEKMTPERKNVAESDDQSVESEESSFTSFTAAEESSV